MESLFSNVIVALLFYKKQKTFSNLLNTKQMKKFLHQVRLLQIGGKMT